MNTHKSNNYSGNREDNKFNDNVENEELQRLKDHKDDDNVDDDDDNNENNEKDTLNKITIKTTTKTDKRMQNKILIDENGDDGCGCESGRGDDSGGGTDGIYNESFNDATTKTTKITAAGAELNDKNHHNSNNQIKNGDVKEIKMNINDTQKNLKVPIVNERIIDDDIERILKAMPLTDETSCGFWVFKGNFFQKFANKKAYVILYGIVGCIFSMTYAYFNGTITTIEKRFKIPSRNTGIISVGNDISTLFVSAVLSYYAGKGHRPRWIGFGLLTIVLFCLLTALPHFLYGPGEDALLLTKEHGAIDLDNATLHEQRTKTLCRINNKGKECEVGEGNVAPQLVLFLAQFISGIGGSLYYTLGVSYMDDNIKKSKTPALLSLSYFMRMLGPAIGYALASFCLRIYISPNLTPIINNNDPRWLGAYWLGWIILGVMLFVSAIFLAMFPRTLPRAVARKILEKEKNKNNLTQFKEQQENELPASFKDMMKTFKKLVTNATLMCNNIASIFYFFGYMPYWIFTPKYIEIQYRQSAATSSLVTGTVALAFSAIGILLSGFVISKYKPRARYMAAWNVAVGFFSVVGILAYSYLGCPGNEKSVVINIPESNSPTLTCNSACQCDYVRYSPICGENGNTYISPCHAGCKGQYVGLNGRKIFYDCECIAQKNTTFTSKFFERLYTTENGTDDSVHLGGINPASKFTSLNIPLSGQAIPGACPVDCFKQFVMFLSVMCFLKFIGATGRASNFLVSVRCVPEKDKTAAMGFGLMMMSLFAFIPSPIFFGWVLDKLCLVWGKTCTNKGNCWLYDAETLRYNLNVIAAIFVAIGTIFDVGVWYYVKDLKIFDEELKETELQDFTKEERRGSRCIKDGAHLN